jgi:hypothetical protein
VAQFLLIAAVGAIGVQTGTRTLLLLPDETQLTNGFAGFVCRKRVSPGQDATASTSLQDFTKCIFKILIRYQQVRTDIAELRRRKPGGLTCIHDGFTIVDAR